LVDIKKSSRKMSDIGQIQIYKLFAKMRIFKKVSDIGHDTIYKFFYRFNVFVDYAILFFTAKSIKICDVADKQHPKTKDNQNVALSLIRPPQSRRIQ